MCDRRGCLVTAADAQLRERARRYSLSVDELRAWVARHDGNCWICVRYGRGTVTDGILHAQVIDHCPTTARPRGAVCEHCNYLLIPFDSQGMTGGELRGFERGQLARLDQEPGLPLLNAVYGYLDDAYDRISDPTWRTGRRPVRDRRPWDRPATSVPAPRVAPERQTTLDVSEPEHMSLYYADSPRELGEH